jgi:hypothetical protein
VSTQLSSEAAVRTPARSWRSPPVRDEGRCLCACGCDVDRDFLPSTHCGLCQLRIHAEPN